MNDREELVAKLNAGRGDLLASVEGLTNEQAAMRPADGGWTPLECLEHVATVETLLLRRVQTQSTELPAELGREREPELYARISTRSHKVQAPELVHPKGRFTTVSDAVGAFLDARERTLQWLAKCDFDLRRRAVEHPALGPASAYEFVLIMAAHPARHAAQIQEGRAAR
jgi:hypothetical protein